MGPRVYVALGVLATLGTLAVLGAVSVSQPPAIYQETTEAFTLFVDCAAGDDRNNCRSVGAPCRTLNRALDAVPSFVKHVVTIKASPVTDAGDPAICTYGERLDFERFHTGEGGFLVVEGRYVGAPLDAGGAPCFTVVDQTGVENLWTYVVTPINCDGSAWEGGAWPDQSWVRTSVAQVLEGPKAEIWYSSSITTAILPVGNQTEAGPTVELAGSKSTWTSLAGKVLRIVRPGVVIVGDGSGLPVVTVNVPADKGVSASTIGTIPSSDYGTGTGAIQLHALELRCDTCGANRYAVEVYGGHLGLNFCTVPVVSPTVYGSLLTRGNDATVHVHASLLPGETQQMGGSLQFATSGIGYYRGGGNAQMNLALYSAGSLFDYGLFGSASVHDCVSLTGGSPALLYQSLFTRSTRHGILVSDSAHVLLYSSAVQTNTRDGLYTGGSVYRDVNSTFSIKADVTMGGNGMADIVLGGAIPDGGLSVTQLRALTGKAWRDTATNNAAIGD